MSRTDVAALILTKNVEVIGHSVGDGHLVLELETCDIVCCYVSPNIEMHQYELEVDNIMNRIDRRQTIVLGDINAKSPQWGASRTDKKGAYWLQWIHALDMVVLNTGREPTFVRGQTKSYIDVTLSTNLIAKQITDWKGLDHDSLTEHNYIFFEIKGAKKERSIGKGKPITTVDWDRFRRSIRTMADETEAQEHDQCTRLIQAAYRKSTQKQCNTTNTPYWWNENIDKKRKQCNKLRRNQTRAARSQGVNRQAANDAKEAYKVCKKDLVKTIRDTKWQCWKRLCAELDTNIWGDAYRIVTKKFGMLAPYDLSIDKRRQILCVFFPPSLEKLRSGAPAGNVPPFTADELECATVNMKPVGAADERTLMERANQCLQEISNNSS
ncbi:Endonuclease-reverse transcriptase [Popillia japonica]|uniref:Endonuclease-reverse transcriptase n=1 Tax=Popillia japonica TaxID=7064 RepID=A0AAW1MRY5_POPJA